MPAYLANPEVTPLRRPAGVRLAGPARSAIVATPMFAVPHSNSTGRTPGVAGTRSFALWQGCRHHVERQGTLELPVLVQAVQRGSQEPESGETREDRG